MLIENSIIYFQRRAIMKDIKIIVRMMVNKLYFLANSIGLYLLYFVVLSLKNFK